MMSSSCHPSRPIVELAAKRLCEEAARQGRRRDIEILTAFRAAMRADRFGTRQSLGVILREASLVPPRPSTVRGLMGSWVIRLQAKVLWWLVRSIRLRDRAIESLCYGFETAVLEQDERFREIEIRLDRLESSSGRSEEPRQPSPEGQP